MKNEHDTGRDPRSSASERVAEIDGFYARLRGSVGTMLDELGMPTSDKPALILKKINDLEKVHTSVLTAEDTFHAKFGHDTDEDTIDFDALRAELGRQLDRIRGSLRTDGVFVRSDG